MKFSEKWGDNIESAVALALADLGLTREQVTVTVLEEPSKGFLGIGAKLAKVRVEEICTKQEKPKAAKAEKPEKVAEEKPKATKTEKKKTKEKKIEKEVKDNTDFVFEDAALLSERPKDLVEVEKHVAKDFLIDMFKEMGLDVSVKVFTGNDYVYAEVEGPDCGTVIGKRGQTLDSVQYLTSLVVNKGQSKYQRTIIDAEGYRKKREQTLEKLAVRLADKAISSKKRVSLEPMNPYERKVIHSVLQQYEGVTTKSEGSEPYRRVVIEPVK